MACFKVKKKKSALNCLKPPLFFSLFTGHPHRIFTKDTDFSTRLAFALFIETLQVCCLSNGALLGALLLVT